MKSDNTIYTDGRRVAVTGHSLRVGKRIYPLNDISRYGLSKIIPERKTGVLMVLAGIAIGATAWLEVIPDNVDQWIPSLAIYGFAIPKRELLESIGTGLFVSGLLALIFTPVRYSVRIAIGAGEMDVVTSRKKKYISQIVEGLGEGLRRLHAHSRQQAYSMSVNR
jgi:Family of unknown function (DUF6232)